MNVHEFKLKGCKIELMQAKNPEQAHMYIINPDGKSVGLATVTDNNFSEVEWAWTQYGDLTDIDFTVTQWRYLQHCGRILTEIRYRTLVKQATVRQEEDHRVKARQRAIRNCGRKVAVVKSNIRLFIQFPRKAPQRDGAGLPILEGDILVNKHGDAGVVEFHGCYDEPTNQWRVNYGDRVSRLCLQEDCHVR